MEAYDGPQIVGMDMHGAHSVLVRMTPDGQKLATARIDNTPAGLAAEVGEAARRRRSSWRRLTGGTGPRTPGGRARRSTWRTRSGGEGVQLPPGQKRRERRR